jgi:hypothetical protein
MSKTDGTSSKIEELIDKNINALVNAKLESGEKITEKEIIKNLTEAYEEANKLGLISEEDFKDLTQDMEITKSIPQESKIEFENTGTNTIVKNEYSQKYDLKQVEQGAKDLEDIGLIKEANEFREKYTESVSAGEIKKIPQPDKIVKTGKIEPSKLKKSVKEAMGGKESVSVPEFKESTWQKVKNFLHIGKGHDARKQEYVKKISKDLIDQAKNIGAKSKNTSSTKPLDQKTQISKDTRVSKETRAR